MPDFRKLVIGLVVVVAFAGLASAQVGGNPTGGTPSGQTFECSATNGSVTPTLRAEGYAEQAGDFVIVCSGGVPATPGNVIPTANITLTFNATVTSRFLPSTGATGSANASEALLLIDEPGSALPGYGPAQAQIFCGNPAAGAGPGGCVEWVGQSGATTGAPVSGSATSTTPGANVFQGVVSGNQVAFNGIPVLPPAYAGESRVFRIVNVRVNANGVVAGSAMPGSVSASISINSTTAFPVPNDTLTVAFVEQGLNPANTLLTNSGSTGSAAGVPQCSGAGVTSTNSATDAVGVLQFQENFQTAFKVRQAAAAQNIPGSIYNSESNFIAPYVTASNTAGTPAVAGLADYATRLKATFSNVPSGVALYVSTNDVVNDFNGGFPTYTGYSSSYQAALVVSESAGDGGINTGAVLTPPTATFGVGQNSGAVLVPYAPVAINAATGSGMAVWEVINTNPNQYDTIRFGLYVNYPANSPAPCGMTVTLSYAPTPSGGSFASTTGAASSSTLPIPRFSDSLDIATNANQPGCSYAVAPLNPPVAPTGGQGAITVATQAGCTWTSVSNASWIALGTQGASSVQFTATPNSTGAQRNGTLTIAGQTVTVTQAASAANLIPSLTSLSPFQGQGSLATLTLVYGHPNGWAAIQNAAFIINPNWEPGSTNGGCLVEYAPATELWTLIADDGVSVAGTALLGSSATLSNSQCSLMVGGSSVSGSGTTLTMVASLSFTSTFTGQRHIWMEASDYNNLSTNWLVYGVWFPVAQTLAAEPWWQIYDPFAGNWLYSGDPNEYATLKTEGFTQQGELGQVMNVPGTVGGLSNIIWYRMYVNSTSSHFWTSDRNEFLTDINQQQAYVGEGVAAFVMAYLTPQGTYQQQVTNTIPFWRGVSTNSNLHYWTVATTPFNAATGYGEWPPGYIEEGIACYIFPTASAQFNNDAPVALSPAVEEAEDRDDGSPAVVSVSNGASYARNGVIAPGQVLNIHGRHLGGTVLLNGMAAQVISAKANEIRVVAPLSLAGAAEAALEVESQGRRTKPVRLSVVKANPAIFGSNVFGKGNAQAMNEDGTANGPEHAASHGSVVTLYTTGYDPVKLPMEVHVGGYPAEIVSAHPSATRAGVVEVQIRVPATVPAAAFQPVVLRLGHLYSQPGVGLAIQ